MQRVPVRIALDPQQLKSHPLRVGLSMEASVDVTHKDGKTLADVPTTIAPTQTEVYSAMDEGANADVRRVIAENIGNSKDAGMGAGTAMAMK